MQTDSPIAASPELPKDSDGPVFNAPWEAQAFALVISLHQQGAFSWNEWATALSQQIDSAKQRGEEDLGDTYYEHWLKALEQLSFAKGLTDNQELQIRSEDWRQSYLDTPHGQPIELIRRSN